MSKKLISAITIIFLAFLGLNAFRYLPQEDKWNNCLIKYRYTWGEPGSSCQLATNTYKVYLRNTCDETLDAVVCVQESSKRWKYYSFKKLAPKDSVSAYACVGTGKIMKFVKPAGNAELVLPTADEINATYAK